MSRQRVAVCLIMMCAATGMAFAQMGTPNLAPATPTATALNADDETVLVPGFNWSTSTTNISAAQDGTVTGESIGTGDVIATETESGVSGSASVTVVVSETTAPTVSSTIPVDGAAGVAINRKVTAIFSEAMNPSTVTTATFTLKRGRTAVPGTVSCTGTTATFEPANPLTSAATHIATITTGAEDLAGNSLENDHVWSFTTGQAPVFLGWAGSFAVLAGSTVTNTGLSAVNGDLGVSPGSGVTGFPPGVVNGAIHSADPTAAEAKLDLTTAYDDAAGRAGAVVNIPTGELGGLTLTPGLYRSGISSFALTSVDLTLDAQGDPDAVFVFQMPSSTLTVGNGRHVMLSGGANSANIYWQVGSSATPGTTSVFRGNILAAASITLQTLARLDGRALTQTAAVTLDASTINRPQ
ncbi:MAG: ice-binding family protein [Armatimonadota bacterium]|jgi:hypothetical protein